MAGVTQTFPSLQGQGFCHPLQKGIWWAQQEGDLGYDYDIFKKTIHEQVAPGEDPNNPNGADEAVHRFPLKY